ncbi:MAG TPA: TIGR03087 family PEP-CTERM/XrtA system glycosyltransferase [Planctomycetota bacterium]|nr:TIGR03087 family PEP-CTERM/XrtA system glycosyltransferase [Planctomycetota bacterium]
MNILYIAQRVPYPPNRGDKIASYNAIRYLARKHSVCVAAIAGTYDELEHAHELGKQGFEVDVALRRPLSANLGAFRALFSGIPLSVAYYRSPVLAQMIARRASKVRFDVVVTFSSSMGQYTEELPGVPIIADFVDMDSRKWQLYSSYSRWPRSWIYSTEERRLLEYERHLARRASCTLVRTELEREDCMRLIPGARFEVLSNGVDLDFFKPAGPKTPSSNMVFTGVMDYFPNVQAVMYFANEVLPLIQEEVPDASFTIVGTRPTCKVLALGRRPGIVVTGQVPDVRPYIRLAAVAVAPLLLARGIQNKVLEAMAMETPVVTTRAAFRGVDAPVGDGVVPADNPRAFADRVLELLKDPALAAEIGRRGRLLVERRYVWDEQLARLESILNEVVPADREAEHYVTRSG